MPKKGPNQNNVKRMLEVIRASGKKGIWIRELSRQTQIPFTTVHLYLNKYLENEVNIRDIQFGLAKSNKFKVVRLKRFDD